MRPATIANWAKRLGLRKDPAYRSAVQAANASKRRLTVEQRDHMRRLAQGRKVSAETIAKALRTKRERGTILRGPAHPGWKGGRPWERFRDPRYLAWRNAVLERDGYRCRRCGRQCKKHERGLAAHHLKAYATHTAERFDVSNGVTLCRECHMSEHGKSLPPPALVACACGCGTLIPSIDRYGRPRRFVNHHGSSSPRGGRRWAPVVQIPCACGCGALIASHDRQGRPRSYVRGHAKRGPMSDAERTKLSRERRGKPMAPGHGAKVREGQLRSTKRIGRPPKSR